MKKSFLDNIGLTLVELTLVASIVGVIPITVYLEAQKMAKTAVCVSNLRNIYMGIQMYEMDFEMLPDAKFYPESPKTDPKSIMNILGSYIDDKNVYLCPTMPDELLKKSLTYIWNDAYNKKFLYKISGKGLKWMMTEMTAVESKIPPPHRGSYNMLFVDGHIETLKDAPRMTPTSADLNEEIKSAFFAEKPKRKDSLNGREKTAR